MRRTRQIGGLMSDSEDRSLPAGSLPEGSDRKSVSRLHEYEEAVNPNIAGHRMSERARIQPLRTGAFFTRPDSARSRHVVSGFLPADDEEKRGNENDTDENIHQKRHGPVPPSRAIFIHSIARRREAIKNPCEGCTPVCRIGLISACISFNNILVIDQADDAYFRPP